MKRSIEALVVIPMLLVIAAMAILGVCGIARAEPVQQFSFQVKSPSPGDLAVRLHIRRFDTTGGVPPTPTDFALRFPRGVELNRAFLTIAAFAILGAADERSAIVRRYPVVAGVHAVEPENLVSDPTPDGLYDLKLEINTGPINGFQVSIAEVNARARSLVLRRGTCLTRGSGGRCVRRQSADASLFELPRCPSSGHYSAQLLSAYSPPTPPLTTTLEVPCPRYVS